MKDYKYKEFNMLSDFPHCYGLIGCSALHNGRPKELSRIIIKKRVSVNNNLISRMM